MHTYLAQKTIRGLVILACILNAAGVSFNSVHAMDYSSEDPGFIQNIEIQMDGSWNSRPGLDSIPIALNTGPFQVRGSLLLWSGISTVTLTHGRPSGLGLPYVEQMTIDSDNQLSAEIPAVNPADFDYCQPIWAYAFYLKGYDSQGNQLEIDERHYADGSGGDPYIFEIRNPTPNISPVADPDGPYTVNRGVPLALHGTGSVDPEGRPLSYEWTINKTWGDFEPIQYLWDGGTDSGIGSNPTVTFFETGRYQVQLRVTDECGDEAVRETVIDVYDPHVVVSPQNDQISGLNWPEEVELTLEINGEVIGKQTTHFLNDKAGFGVDFNLREDGFDIVPGMLVELSGGGNTASHVVRNHTIETVDVDQDLVSGTADPGSYVRVRITEPYWVEVIAFADDSRRWEADFLDLPEPIDITTSTQINVIQQNDTDSSHTIVFWNWPWFQVHPQDDRVEGINWPLDKNVEISIDDPKTTNLNPDFSTSRIVSDFAPWDPNQTYMEFNLDGTYDLKAGDIVTLSAGSITKEHTVTDLIVSDVDVPGNTVSGTTDTALDVQVWVHPGLDGSFVTVPMTDPGGWTAYFPAHDLVLGEAGPAVQYDEDGDGTWVEWWVASYTLHAVPAYPEIHGHDWPAGEMVTLIIDDDTDPNNGILYTETRGVDEDPWCGNPCFDLLGVFNLQVGQYVTMTDGAVSKTVHVSQHHITAVNFANETLSGIADPLSDVMVNIWSQDGKARHAVADANGFWMVDFSVFGDEDFEQFTTDIGPEDHGRAIQLNPDGSDDGTLQYWPLPNTPPDITNLMAPVSPVQLGQPITATATFNDPDTGDVHSAVWDWGDGTTASTLAAPPTAIATHTYATPGVYTVTVTITDAAGESDTDVFQYVVIYDPNGRFVTGGGWINSPTGAYTPNPSLTGKATFGFVSKYQKGASVPTGNTEFQFHMANMNFKSTSYDWLVVAGTKAQYKGTGTINGTGIYSFMLTATDGSPDKFRIKIWDKATGEVIYDNMLGASDNADPITAIQGGSIVIHKPK